VSKKILITGGAGFPGSHLGGRLLREGRDVLSVDNYFAGAKSRISFKPLPQVYSRQRQPHIKTLGL